jgi:hypothetical protein
MECPDEHVVILFKGGRLPSWFQLSDTQRRDVEQTHVDLMLSVAQRHGMTRLEGFRLIDPQDSWQRFWLIEFPSMTGAERWIEAEMAPPYGLYGFYEYQLSRPWNPDVYSRWVTDPAPTVVALDADPHTIPVLNIDTQSIVLLMFDRFRPQAEGMTPQQRGDAQHDDSMREIARRRGLRRLEGFQLLTPQHDWHRAWVIELPTLEAAEAWVEAEESLPYGMYVQRSFHLARRWAPEYFMSWVKHR